jgi:hypothetical protein
MKLFLICLTLQENVLASMSNLSDAHAASLRKVQDTKLRQLLFKIPSSYLKFVLNKQRSFICTLLDT